MNDLDDLTHALRTSFLALRLHVKQIESSALDIAASAGKIAHRVGAVEEAWAILLEKSSEVEKKNGP